MSYRLMAAVLYRSQGRPVERLVLVALAERANTKTGRCWPSVQELCARTRYHRTTVLRALRQLEKRGELAITVRRRRGNLYRITLPEMAQPYVAERDLGRRISKSRSATRIVAESDSSGRGERLQPVRNQSRNRSEDADAPVAHRRRAHARHRFPAASGDSDRLPPTPSAASASRGSRTPDPAVKRLLDAFCVAHLEALSQRYLIRGARDGKHLKDALRVYDEATILRAIPVYLADRQSIARLGASIPLFVGRIATLAGSAPNDVEDFTGRGQALVAAEAAAVKMSATP
jgi:hypothetical protein